MSLRSGSRALKALLYSSIVVAFFELVVFLGLGRSLEAVYSQPLGRLLLAILVVELIILLLVIWIYAKRKLVKRINVLANALERGAEGDLTIRVQAPEDDEIGELGHNLNQMLEKLGEFVNRVNISLNELRGISMNTTDAAVQLVQASGSQSAAVKDTSNAVSEINSSIDALSLEIDNLTQSAAKNSGAISTMTASMDIVGQNIDAQTISIEEVSSSIVEVAAAVRQIAGNVNNLMSTATTTSTSVAQLDATIKQVEQNAQEAASITENVRRDAIVGQEAVAATISGIGEISSSTQFTLTSIDSLSSRVKAIGNILLVINELADQTNLLALNSAIIAAQAGEHGKGFAVVSDQIKRLAMRTRNSTQEIADLISGIQKETGQASDAIKTTEKRVAEGVLLSRKSGDALQKIVSGMEMTLCQVNDIATTTVEQAKGSQQIRQAMEIISEMVSQIAKSTQEQGATSGFITSSVDRMKELTEYVKTSSREQRNLGLEIAGSTNSITGIVGEVERLRNDLSKRSQMIRMAIEDMHKANNADLAVVKAMEEGVDNLSRQTSIIQEEMAKLKVA